MISQMQQLDDHKNLSNAYFNKVIKKKYSNNKKTSSNSVVLIGHTIISLIYLNIRMHVQIMYTWAVKIVCGHLRMSAQSECRISQI